MARWYNYATFTRPPHQMVRWVKTKVECYHQNNRSTDAHAATITHTKNKTSCIEVSIVLRPRTSAIKFSIVRTRRSISASVSSILFNVSRMRSIKNPLRSKRLAPTGWHTQAVTSGASRRYRNRNEWYSQRNLSSTRLRSRSAIRRQTNKGIGTNR